MTKEEIDIIAGALKDSSKVGTLNALTFIVKGLQALKAYQVPVLSYNMANELIVHGYREPNFKESIDFLISFFELSIENIEGAAQAPKEEK